MVEIDSPVELPESEIKKIDVVRELFYIWGCNRYRNAVKTINCEDFPFIEVE